jgi:hypothetical protein
VYFGAAGGIQTRYSTKTAAYACVLVNYTTPVLLPGPGLTPGLQAMTNLGVEPSTRTASTCRSTIELVRLQLLLYHRHAVYDYHPMYHERTNHVRTLYMREGSDHALAT